MDKLTIEYNPTQIDKLIWDSTSKKFKINCIDLNISNEKEFPQTVIVHNKISENIIIFEKYSKKVNYSHKLLAYNYKSTKGAKYQVTLEIFNK